MYGWVDKQRVGFKMVGLGKIQLDGLGKIQFFFLQQSLSILLNSFDLILTLKILECVEGNFHAPVQSNAIYNE